MTEREFTDNMKNRLWRLNNLYMVMDDQGNKVRFRLNAVQHILYKALWWLNVVLKSRQHGITTFVCIFFLDACLFNENVRAGIIAHKLKDAQKIFRDKIKFAYDNLPASLKKQCVPVKDDALELLFEHNSGIYVGTSMRSGTLQYLHISEYGWLCAHTPQKAKEIKSGAMETVHQGGIIIVESTAEGVGNDFQKLCTTAQNNSGKELSRMDYRFHFFPWYKKLENQLFEAVAISEDLQKYFARIENETGDRIADSYRAWYSKKKITLGSDTYKEHPSTAEEAFLASIEGSYYGARMIQAEEEGRVTMVQPVAYAKVYSFWDIGDIHTSIWFCQFIKNQIRCVDYYEDNAGLGLPEYGRVLQAKPYIYGDHFAPPDIGGSNRKSFQTGKTTLDIAAEAGIHFKVIEPHRIEDRIAAVRDVVLNQCWFDKIRCEFGIKCLKNYRKEKDELASSEDITVYKNRPYHDGFSHGADAFGYMAMAFMYEMIGGSRLGATRPQSIHEDAPEPEYDLLGL